MTTHRSLSDARGIFVLGMHRSGTSCLTGLLETSGVWMGEVVRKKRRWNPRGNLENATIRKLNDALLQANGGEWHSPPDVITVDDRFRPSIAEQLDGYKDRALWCLKDPRMVLLVDAWLAAATVDVELVGTFRHPVAVARSIEARNEIPVERGLRIWELYNRALVRQHRARQFPLVTFDCLGDAYLRQFERLCHELRLPYRDELARAFYERDFISQAQEFAEPIPDANRETYEYLRHHALVVE